ncbi:unnamed protein product [Sphacelaria rigidula]
MSAEEVLCKVLQGVARPLQSRVSTVLESVREVGIGYRLLNLLSFYAATVGQLAGPASPLLDALSECRRNADETFRHAMKREVRTYVRIVGDSVLSPVREIIPPPC